VRVFASLTDPHLIATLNDGGVVVIPTDTIYGIVARITDQRAVERIYRLRGRVPEKPCIILVSEPWQANDTSLWTNEHKKLVDKYWPGPLSLVTPTTEKTPEYLHRGTNTLAYRMPDHAQLRKLLGATGPLIAPSANREGDPPATTLAEAQAYFGDTVDGYVDGGSLANHVPSTVVRVKNDKPEVLRHGAVILGRS
jgi:L-threonylcarbamoyladenylate synthase